MFNSTLSTKFHKQNSNKKKHYQVEQKNQLRAKKICKFHEQNLDTNHLKYFQGDNLDDNYPKT